MADKGQESPIHSIVKLMCLAGVPLKNISLRYEPPDTKCNVTIAAPDIKFAIIFPGDNYDGLDDDGWLLMNVNMDEATAFSKVFKIVEEMEVAATYASVEGPASNVSKSENLLYDALVRRGVAKGEFELSRSKKFYTDAGEYISQPDFVWEKEKFIVEFDGLWNHGGRSDTDLIKSIRGAKDDKTALNLVGRKSSKQAKDAKKRRYLSELGYTVMVITDEDFYGSTAEEAVNDAADSIVKALYSRRREMSGISEDEAKSVIDLLDGDDSEENQQEDHYEDYEDYDHYEDYEDSEDTAGDRDEDKEDAIDMLSDIDDEPEEDYMELDGN